MATKQTRTRLHLLVSVRLVLCLLTFTLKSIALLCDHFLSCVHSEQKQKKIKSSYSDNVLLHYSIPFLNFTARTHARAHTQNNARRYNIISLGKKCEPHSNSGTRDFSMTVVCEHCLLLLRYVAQRLASIWRHVIPEMKRDVIQPTHVRSKGLHTL
jgi:hypothetical protein